MTQANRGRIIGAVVLIALGLYFFAIQFFPALRVLAINQTTWPLIIVGVGVALLVGALLFWIPSLMIPASVVGGLGALLLWQNSTDNWSSWAYAWTIFPMLTGIGIFLMNLMQGYLRRGLTAGGTLFLIGLAMFLIFGSFFGALGLLGQFWPLLLIVLGVFVLGQSFFRRNNTSA